MRVDMIAGWLEPEEKIGELDIRQVRGREVVTVSFDQDWLVSHRTLMLDPDLAPFRERQYPPSDRFLFGFLSDAAPDRWGRKLIERSERMKADTEHRPVRTLNETDYLFGISDELRYGGIRFLDQSTGEYLSSDGAKVPPMTDIRMLEAAVRGYEISDHDEEFLRLLVDPGSSLGGARPKANVVDADNQLWIAKFPSRKDDYDVGAWEMVEHDLAKKCGLDVPDAMLMKLSDHGSTFLTRRFDRENGKRLHLMSFMTALSQTDGHTDGIGYIDLAGQLEEMSACPDKDLHELWKRMAFNVLTSNCDDHLRNHGLILREDGWHLSPAYDLNPTTEKNSLSLNIIGNDSRKNVKNAIGISELFRIPEWEAKNITEDMQNTIRTHWRSLAAKYHIPEKEMRDMQSAFDECEHDLGRQNGRISVADALNQAERSSQARKSQKEKKPKREIDDLER